MRGGKTARGAEAERSEKAGLNEIKKKIVTVTKTVRSKKQGSTR